MNYHSTTNTAHPIEFELIRLKQFFGTANGEQKCIAYATRLIDQGSGEFEVRKAVDYWINQKTTFPSFSDLHFKVGEFRPKRQNNGSESELKCTHHICDGSGWIYLVEIHGNPDHTRMGRCKCHSDQTEDNFYNQMRVYRIPDDAKRRYAHHNQISEENLPYKGLGKVIFQFCQDCMNKLNLHCGEVWDYLEANTIDVPLEYPEMVKEAHDFRSIAELILGDGINAILQVKKKGNLNIEEMIVGTK